MGRLGGRCPVLEIEEERHESGRGPHVAGHTFISFTKENAGCRFKIGAYNGFISP